MQLNSIPTYDKQCVILLSSCYFIGFMLIGFIIRSVCMLPAATLAADPRSLEPVRGPRTLQSFPELTAPFASRFKQCRAQCALRHYFAFMSWTQTGSIFRAWCCPALLNNGCTRNSTAPIPSVAKQRPPLFWTPLTSVAWGSVVKSGLGPFDWTYK